MIIKNDDMWTKICDSKGKTLISQNKLLNIL